MYGGGTGTSAYMLQYRKYDPSLKAQTQDEDKDTEKDRPWQNIEIGDDLIPDYLRKDIEQETNELIEK